MPKAPGTYVSEFTPDRTQAGVVPAVTGFVGILSRGPVNEPVTITSWGDFVNKFGSGLKSVHRDDSYMSYSLYGYFQNGGAVAKIVRVTDGTESKASYMFEDDAGNDLVEVEALDPGEWGDNVEVKIETEGEGEDKEYHFKVKVNGSEITYNNIKFSSSEERFIEDRVNGIDKYVKVDVKDNEADDKFESDDLNTWKSLDGGSDGDIDSIDENDIDDGIKAFDKVEELSFLVIPDDQSSSVREKAKEYAEERNTVTYLMDTEKDESVNDVVSDAKSINTSYAAMIYPWIKVRDVLTGDKKFVPPSGHWAGIIARTHDERSAYKAPAGVEAVIEGALDVEKDIKNEEHGDLNEAGVNAIRVFKNVGIVIWGARTLNKDEKGITYLNHRIGLNHLKLRILLETRWVVFEPHTKDTWKRLQVFAKSLLLGEYKGSDGFRGAEPAEAFYAKCDDEIITEDDIKNGIIRLEIGVAIAKPAEFVKIQVGQWEGGTIVTEG